MYNVRITLEDVTETEEYVSGNQSIEVHDIPFSYLVKFMVDVIYDIDEQLFENNIIEEKGDFRVAFAEGLLEKQMQVLKEKK